MCNQYNEQSLFLVYRENKGFLVVLKIMFSSYRCIACSITHMAKAIVELLLMELHTEMEYKGIPSSKRLNKSCSRDFNTSISQIHRVLAIGLNYSKLKMYIGVLHSSKSFKSLMNRFDVFKTKNNHDNIWRSYKILYWSRLSLNPSIF